MSRARTLLGAALMTLATCSTPASAQARPTPSVPSAGVVRGTVVSLDWSELTVQRSGARMSVIGALTHAANVVAAGDYPYVWGGGHAFAGTASIGERGGPGYNGRRIGFDCSGSVAAVLAGAGLWAPGTGVPGDSGVIKQLRQAHVLARGAGVGPRSVTLWDDPGVHIFIQIGDRFFGTTDGGPPSPQNPRGGPAWLDDGAPDTLDRHYRPWHLLPAALGGRVNTGRSVTVGLGGPLADAVGELAVGDRVGVRYATRRRALVAVAVDPLGEPTVPVQ
ncbi:MAG TPA: hypothetical protein VMF07_00205 [Solirubrobacteraceae bacterium]|nr:hypothetical protein [Solirubrobacteraceae bacterium]